MTKFTPHPLFTACLAAGLSNPALAQTTAAGSGQFYPTKPVRMLVGASAGGGVDIIARVFAGRLAHELRQQVVIDNRPGGQSNIAAETAAKSPADGHTLFGVTTTHVMNVSLYRDLKYNLTKDFVAISNLTTAPQVLVVNPQLAAKTVSELVKLAQARPGAINYSSAGAGTAAFITAERFKTQAGINLMHVPYRGGAQALAAVVAGEVSVMFASIAGTQSFMQQGRMRGLAVTSLKRAPQVADLPTVAESGLPGFEAGSFFGLMVPSGAPRNVIDVLNRASITALGDPDTNRRMVDLGYVVIGDKPEQFSNYLRTEVRKMAKIVKDFNLTPE